MDDYRLCHSKHIDMDRHNSDSGSFFYMIKIFFINLLLLALSPAQTVKADEITLTTGERIIGHILQDDSASGRIVIGLVQKGERTGIQEVYFRHEIDSIERDDKFAQASFRSITAQCYQYGWQWGRCTMSAYFGYRCEDLNKIIVPQQCSDTPAMKQGVRDGVSSVYKDYPEIPKRTTKDKSNAP